MAAVTAIAAVASTIQAQDSARRAHRARSQEKDKEKAREAELAREAQAKEAARKEAETLGQRAGFGAGAVGAGSPSTRSTFIGAARAGTGMGNAQMAEDRIGRDTLFGN